jgi:competence protein ComEC
LWVWDIGFELSFLATLGLIVTADPLLKKLDWLPPTIADLISVPLAATIWTLPIQLYVFKVFPLYCLPANILTSPLISIISIGGTIGAFASAIVPLAGSAISAILYVPTRILIGIVDLFNYLPGTSFAVGQMAIWQLVALYGLIFGVWALPKWQRLWRLPVFIGLLLIIVPLFFAKANELQITELASNDRQILVIQDRGKTMLVNTGNESTARFTVVPFLQQQAINQIDNAIDFSHDRAEVNSWQTLRQSLAIQNFYRIDESSNTDEIKFMRLPLGESKQFDRLELKALQASPTILQIELPEHHQKWLIVGDPTLDAAAETVDAARSSIDVESLNPIQTLYWRGGKLTKQAIEKMSPQVAIAATTSPDRDTLKLLEQNNVRVYYTGRDGAIQWTPTGEFKPYLEGERTE